MLTLTLILACGSPPQPAPAADPAPPAAPAAAPVLVSGTIEAPADAPAAQAVFVSLRQAGVRGPPLAAKKLPAGPFPLNFELTEADRPMANGPVPDSFEVKVTLDIDGDPMSKTPEDLEIIQAADKGAAGVTLMLAPRGEAAPGPGSPK